MAVLSVVGLQLAGWPLSSQLAGLAEDLCKKGPVQNYQVYFAFRED